ncbi:MAG: Peptidase family protein [Firmicutes bacterium]|nr:Peptidase family protein [Bacillota bacterium]
MLTVIGVTSSVLVRNDGMMAGGERFFVNRDYLDAVIQAGGMPIILPLATTDKLVKCQVEKVDGVILAGGGDIDPQYYGEEPLAGLEQVFPERDEHELKVLQFACQHGKPVLGICRGIQLMNVAFGGSLYQDLSFVKAPILQHHQSSQKAVLGHTANIVGDTILASIFKASKVRTNSFHHQAVKTVAQGFLVSSRTDDGIVEGIENAAIRLLGVQWHPEMMVEKFPVMRGIFRWLVEGASARTGK